MNKFPTAVKNATIVLNVCITAANYRCVSNCLFILFVCVCEHYLTPRAKSTAADVYS